MQQTIVLKNTKANGGYSEWNFFFSTKYCRIHIQGTSTWRLFNTLRNEINVLFASIDLIEYHISVVKVSNLWCADHEFESDLDFCSYLLDIYLKIIIFTQNCRLPSPFVHCTSHSSCYLSWSSIFLLIWDTFTRCSEPPQPKKKCLLRQYTGRDIGEKMFTGFVFFSAMSLSSYTTRIINKNIYFLKDSTLKR